MGQGQLLCEVSSKSLLHVKRYSTGSPLEHGKQLCETLSSQTWLEGEMTEHTAYIFIRPWANVMTQLLVIDNNCMKYYPDPT